VLVLSSESVEALNRQTSAAVPEGRFRTNILVSGGGAAFAEDSWARVLVGPHAIPLRGVKRCSRCRVTTTDQDPGVAPDDPWEAEPLVTLKRTRADEKGQVYMGVVSGRAAGMLPSPPLCSWPYEVSQKRLSLALHPND
jgi:uncharacterized protein YcbX